MASLLDILKKPAQKVKQTIGSLFGQKTQELPLPVLPPRSSQIQIPQRQVVQAPIESMTSTTPLVQRDITMDDIFKTDRIGTPVTFKETLEHLPTLKEQPKIIASSISMAAEKFLPTKLYKSLDTRFHITDKLVEADKAIVKKSQSLQKALGLNYLSDEHVDSIFEELASEYSQFGEEIETTKDKNPTARAVAHFGGELMNFAMISRIFAGATPVVQRSLMKTTLGTSLSQSRWGLTTLRAISSAASSVPTHATVRSLEEAADQIAEGEFSPTRILGAMARGGLQGALLATAHALPTNPWRIGTAGLFGGSWVTLETLIKNKQVTKEDIPSIAKNAALWMAFEAINSIGLTKAYESDLRANRAKWIMAEKYGKDVADMVNKLDYLEIMYGGKNTELGSTFRDLKNKVIAHEMYHRDVQYIRTGKGEAMTLSEHLTPSEKAILAHLDNMTGEVAPISMKVFEKDPIVREAAINQPDIITRIDSQTAQVRPEVRAEVPLETSLKAISSAPTPPALSMGDILQVPPGLSSKVTPPAEVAREELPQSKIERPTETVRKIDVAEERAVTPETPETTIAPAEKVAKEPVSLEPSNEAELEEAEELMKMGDLFKGEGAEEMTMTTEKKTAEMVDNEMARVEYEVLAEMEISEARSAFRTEEGYIQQPSTFPKWIPEKLRSKKLLDKVAEHIKNETVPSERYTKQKELYDVIQNEMSERIDKDYIIKGGSGATYSYIKPREGTDIVSRIENELINSYSRGGKYPIQDIRLNKFLTPAEKLTLQHIDNTMGKNVPFITRMPYQELVMEARLESPEVRAVLDEAGLPTSMRVPTEMRTAEVGVSRLTDAVSKAEIPVTIPTFAPPKVEDITELREVLKETKGMTADDIMAKHPDIKLKKDVPAKDVYGEKTEILKGEVLTPYELKDNKILLQDGETYVVSKSQYQNIKGHSEVEGVKDVIPDDKIRLYRGLTKEFDPSYDKSDRDAPTGYSLWTDSEELARAYAGDEGFVYQMDLPKEEIGESFIDEQGERPLFYKTDKPASIHGVKGEEYAVYEHHDLFSDEDIRPYKLEAKEVITETKPTTPTEKITKEPIGTSKRITPTERKMLGIEELRIIKRNEYSLLKDKIKNLARGSREGSLYTRKQIVDKQKEFANILKESGLTAKDQSKFITEMRDIAKSAEPEIDFYNKFPDIQRRIERLLDAQTKRDLSSAIDREFKYTKPLKKGDKRVAKYEYEYNKQIEELRGIRKLTQEKAQAKLDELDLIRGGKVEDISEFELIKERIYSLQANGAKASVEIHERVLGDIQRLKRAGEEAKSIEDFFKKIERAERVDEIHNKIVELRPSELRDVGFINKSKNAITSAYHSGISNIGSYLNQIVGKDLSEKYDPGIKQNRMDTSYDNKGVEINKKANKILELKNDRALMKRFVDMAGDKTVMTDIDGVNHDINRLELIDIYNSIKNDVVRERYYWAYGKAQVDSALSNLTDSEKMLGDMLMAEVQNYREILNKRNIEITGRDMGTVENYWPGTTEHQPSVFDDIKIQGETPSALKARSHSTRLIPIPTNAWTKGMKHIKTAEHVDHLSREYENLRRIFTDRRVRGSIVNRYGEKMYRDLLRHIDSISLNREVAITNIVDGVFNKALNNWVSAKMFSPTVFARQLGSTTNYMRHMPATEWITGFMKGVATPKKTAEYMLKRFDFLPARFNRGHDEAARDALAGGNHLKTNVNSWKAIGTLPTRTGDITAIIYGGRPYIEYLDKEAAKKGLKGKEAEDYVRDKFEKVTLKEQQFGGSTGLSLPQQSAGATKAFFRFRNTANQYTRVLVDTTLQFKRGEVSAGFLGKTYFHYALLQPLLYTLIGAGVVGGYKALVRGLTGKSKKKDKDANLAADTAIFMVTQPFTAVPFLGEAMEYTIRKKTGLPSYSMISTPMLDDIERGFQSAFKKEPTLEDYLRFIAAVEEPTLGFPMETFLRYYGYAKEETEGEKKKSSSKKSLEQLRKDSGLPSLTDDIPTTKSSGTKSMDQLRKEAGLPPLH